MPESAPATTHRTSSHTSRAAEGTGSDGEKNSGGSGKGKKRKRSASDHVNAHFDARKLTDGQLDELVHRLIGSLVPRLKIELRMDRERIGRLRDPRR
ncbi:hypothetical protein [Streptomyces sp. NPDC048644]|uniref:hypothetical protein n=1 Tax=Streptomyces sp. NPDC048644 TaxID=3365582 RepID=UPI0037196674